MKAWVATVDGCGCTAVFAETRGKARAVAMCTDAFQDAKFTEIHIYRYKAADGQYCGRTEMDWDNKRDRIFLVKKCGWRCDLTYLTPEECGCGCCPAREWCDALKDYEFSRMA